MTAGVRGPKAGGVLTGLLFVVPVVCCAGLPLLLAAGASAGLVFLVGGLTAGGIAVLVVAALVALRVYRRRKEACRLPAGPDASRSEIA